MGIKVKHTTQATGTYPIEGELGVNEWNEYHEIASEGEYIAAGDVTFNSVDTAALHRSPNAVTAMLVYDTSKDSDGGAWTEKCQDTSWYNEPLSGKWLGAQPSEDFARNADPILTKEILVNGDLSDGLTNWTPQAGAALSITDDGWLRITEVVGTSYGEAQAEISIPATAAGEVYLLTLKYRRLTGNSIFVRLNSADYYSPYITQSISGTYTTVIRTVGVNTGIRICIGNSGLNTYSEVSEVSFRKIVATTTNSGDYYQLTTDGKFYKLPNRNVLAYSSFNGASTTSTMPEGWGSTGGADGSITLLGPDPGIQSNCSAVKIANKAIGYRGVERSYTWLWGAAYTFSVSIRRRADMDSSGPCTLYLGSASPASFTIATSAQINAQTIGEWVRYSIPLTITSSSSNIISISQIATAIDTGFDIAMPQLELNTAATTYEYTDSMLVFRGNKKEFPKLAAIIAEGSNINIYDMTEPGNPMWMRFTYDYLNILGGGGGYSFTCIDAIQGKLAIGSGGWFGVGLADFVSDEGFSIFSHVEYGGRFKGFISNRNDKLGWVKDTTYAPARPGINSISMTVLPDAPIDSKTGLSIPTIALATTTGISIIKHDKTVVNSLSTINMGQVILNRKNLHIRSNTGSQWWGISNHPYHLVNGFSYSIYLVPDSLTPPGSANIGMGVGGRSVLCKKPYNTPSMVFHYLNENYPRGCTAQVHNFFNTGYQVGDMQRVYLSNNLEGTSTSEELILGDNSTFTTGLGNWYSSGATLAVVNSALQVTQIEAHGRAVFAFPTVIGRTYKIEADVRLVSGTKANIGISDTSDGKNTATFSKTQVTSSTFTRIFAIRTANKTMMYAVAGTDIDTSNVMEFDNFSIREVIEDRSYKALTASLFGTIQRSPVATNAQLVSYSGFSQTNYLREPYSPDLDFGTGEWSVSSWVNVPTTLPVESFIQGSELSSFIGPYDMVAGNLEVLFGQTFQAGSFFRISVNLTYGGVNSVKPTLKNASTYGYSPSNTYTGSFTIFVSVTDTVDRFLLQNIGTATGTLINSISVKEVYPAIISDRSLAIGPYTRLGVGPTGAITATASDGTTTRTVTTTSAYNTGTWVKAEACYTTDGTLALRVNGNQVAATYGTPLKTLTSRYNLINYSEALENAYWTKNSCTVADATTLGPDPDSVAKLVTATANASSLSTTAVSLTSGLTYTFSAWIQRVSGTGTVTFRYGPNGNSPDLGVTNGWQRFWWTFVASGTSTDIKFIQLQNLGDSVNVWGLQVEQADPMSYYQRTTTVAETEVAPLTIGNNYDLTAPFPGSLALLKLSATAPTTEQSLWMYEQEKHLFREGVQCCLPDSGALVDLSYDDTSDTWTTVSPTNESTWSGLVRTSTKPVPAGSYNKIATNSGLKLSARVTTDPGVDITTIVKPSIREEIFSGESESNTVSSFDFVGGFTGTTTVGSTSITSVAGVSYPTGYVGSVITGTGIPAGTYITSVSGTTVYISAPATAAGTAVQISFTDFNLPSGHEASAVRVAGALKREGSTSDYIKLYNGFKETVRFTTAPGYTAWVNIQTRRSK